MISAAPLRELGGIRHAFFTRAGGVSEGPFSSLNCGFGSDDLPDRVAENRARAVARLGLPAAALCTAYQCHGSDAASVDQPWGWRQAPRVDAMVTARLGIALGILTADCAPVLFAADGAGVIGAAHVGWKGALAGVIESTVAAMIRLGAEAGKIRAAVGPCIGRESYEVGAEFRTVFESDDMASAEFFRPLETAAKFRFDLAAYVGRRLAALELAEVAVLGQDTLTDEGRFFSYRRACQHGEPEYGRCLSAIAIVPN